jgi:hypothetical protein
MEEKVFLIANNHLLLEHHLELLNINSETDIVVLFNYMNIPFSWFKNIKQKIAFLRVVYEEYHEVNRYYLGGEEFKERQHEFTKLICLDDFGRYNTYKKDINIPCVNLDIETFLNTINVVYNNDIGIPTSGFIAYLYMKELFPKKELILVGFTGHYADGSIPDKVHHNYDWEQMYYKQHAVKSVYSTLSEF